jgi:hypothetical protein
MGSVESAGGTVSFRDFFQYMGRTIQNMGDFWGWKADLITRKLQEMLEELEGFAKVLRENKNTNQAELAENAGSELKRFAAKHGVDLATASLEELAELEKILRDKIVELLKGSLALPKDESQAAATNAADAKAASLNEAQFRMKSLQDVLGSVKTVSRETGLSAYTDLSQAQSDSVVSLCA